MTESLTVWFERVPVGRLSSEQGKWRFIYDYQWLNAADSFPISPHFPFQQPSFVDTADDKRVVWFFENLLPEGGIREALARNASLNTKDTFGLLQRYGEDTAGALTILSTVQGYPPQGSYQPLSREELQLRIANSNKKPLLISSDELRMSLAGVQNKLGIRYDNGEFFLPQGLVASTHIMKPDNLNQDFPFCPANEYFCMRLADALNLPVPGISLHHLPEPIYIVERYDRYQQKHKILRRHQIDLCQMLNKWVGYKYENDWGITLQDVFHSLDYLEQPAVARDRIIRWVIFNYLIANNDAHGKNLSFLVSNRGIRLAPFYDLLCVEVYLPSAGMAMTIEGENKPGWIEATHWRAFAALAGVPYRLVCSNLQKQTASILVQAGKILATELFSEKERKFLHARVLPIIQGRVAFAKAALNQGV